MRTTERAPAPAPVLLRTSREGDPESALARISSARRAPLEHHPRIRHAFIPKGACWDAPMTHWHGQKAGTDTYHHGGPYPSAIHLHERPRGGPAAPGR